MILEVSKLLNYRKEFGDMTSSWCDISWHYIDTCGVWCM